MITDEIAVHITSDDQYDQVVSHYRESKGWFTAGLKKDNWMSFPYIFYNGKNVEGLISGMPIGVYFSVIVEFDEWLEQECGICMEQPEPQSLSLLFG